MKKYIKYIVIVVIIMGIFSPVFMLRASEENPNVQPYVLLAPLPCEIGSENCNSDGEFKTFDPTNDTALGSYLNTMLRIFIGICAVLAMIMIVLGGLEYMTSGLISSKDAGKKKIIGALFGLILALSSYALLNTINPDLLKTDITSMESVTIKVILDDNIPQTPINGFYSNGVAVDSPWNEATAGPLRTPPPPENVILKNHECSYVGEQNCTSTRGLLNMSIVLAIQNGCHCSLVITGGTEFWLHGGASGNTSHQAGSATVDLRTTPALDRYLSEGKPLVNFTRYQSPVGPVFYETDHWHIGS